MSQQDASTTYDAIIIGAGVIGAAIAHELAGRGWRTLTVDKASAAGAGSTSNSCAIVRFSYSSVEGINLAWEGMHYWKDWSSYIGADDEFGLIDYHMTGQLVLQPSGEGASHAARVKMLWDEMGIPHEVWDTATIRERCPYLDPALFGPPARPEDEEFWKDPTGAIETGYFTPDAGYVSDPQLSCHNLQRGAEANGAEFRFRSEVVAISTEGGRCTGVELADGSRIDARVVVNVAGPHSSHVNRLAGVYDSMNIKTEAIRHETYHVPGPPDADFTEVGFAVADDDNGIYFRPQPGNNILVGTTDPPCDPREVVDPDGELGELTNEGWETNTLRINKRMPSLGVPLPHEKRGVVDRYDRATTGSRSTTAPTSTASTSRSAPAATSSRTQA